MNDGNRGSGIDEPRRRRFKAQAIALGGVAVAIYIGYLAFMIAKGTGAV